MLEDIKELSGLHHARIAVFGNALKAAEKPSMLTTIQLTMGER
jgi:hypothetical protein